MYSVKTEYEGPFSIRATIETSCHSQVVGQIIICEQKVKTICNQNTEIEVQKDKIVTNKD